MFEAISNARLFEGIPLDGLAELARHGVRRRFGRARLLMHQGDVSETMYVLLKGRVRVERSVPDVAEPLVLAELGPGDVVGEMGLLDHQPRSASVVALEDTEAMELDDLALAQTVLRYPEVSAALLRVLSSRLRSTDELAAELARRSQGEVSEQ